MINHDNLVLELLAWQKKLENNRSNVEGVWKDVASYIRPERNSFTNKTIAETSKNIYDSTALLASEFLISAIWGMVSSSANEWFHLKPKNHKLLNDVEINNWFKEVNFTMKAELMNASSGFYYKSYEFYSDLICFGTGVFYVGEDIETNSLSYACKNLANCYLDQSNNKVDVIFRKIYLTSKEAIQRFGINNIAKNMADDFENGGNTKYLFIHAVIPKSYVEKVSVKLRNMKYLSYYIDVANQQIVYNSGYNEFPYIVARWFTSPAGVYGESPATSALPDIKMLNAISKTLLIAIQKQVDPPILAPNEAVIQGVKTNPGGIIYGGIDPINGNQLFRPLVNNLDLSSANLLKEQKRQAIREAFYYSLLFASYTNNATATEVLSVNEQRMQLLGAKIARIQTEFLYPLLLRQYKVMLRLNKFIETPKGFNPYNVEIEFYGIWNRYQKTIESNPLIFNIADSGKPKLCKITNLAEQANMNCFMCVGGMKAGRYYLFVELTSNNKVGFKGAIDKPFFGYSKPSEEILKASGCTTNSDYFIIPEMTMYVGKGLLKNQPTKRLYIGYLDLDSHGKLVSGIKIEYYSAGKYFETFIEVEVNKQYILPNYIGNTVIDIKLEILLTINNIEYLIPVTNQNKFTSNSANELEVGVRYLYNSNQIILNTGSKAIINYNDGSQPINLNKATLRLSIKRLF